MRSNRKRNIENIFAICILTVFSGQIYISPFLQWFRFSFAVITLSVLLLYFKDVPIILVNIIIAVCMSFFRAFVYFMSADQITFLSSLTNYLPVALFYIVFGLLFHILNVRDKLNRPIAFISVLWLCDSTGNFAEALVRRIFVDFSFDKATYYTIVIGLIRSVMIYLGYYITLYYKKRYEKEQNENRFKKLVLFISELKAEIFFLAKSREDIENTMEKSYKLYENIEDQKLKEEVLDIAKNIHEIKKDYYRVLAGIEETLSKGNENISIDISELLNIIKENTDKIIKAKKKNIKININVSNNFQIQDFYSLTSILNNLIINSIDAINFFGEINIIEYKENNNYVFEVKDDGCGIEEDDLDIIFEPGYTTKYDSLTGDMSTGLGLSHVRQIVEDYYEGDIFVHSISEKGTAFKIVIPASKIENEISL